MKIIQKGLSLKQITANIRNRMATTIPQNMRTMALEYFDNSFRNKVSPILDSSLGNLVKQKIEWCSLALVSVPVAKMQLQIVQFLSSLAACAAP